MTPSKLRDLKKYLDLYKVCVFWMYKEVHQFSKWVLQGHKQNTFKFKDHSLRFKLKWDWPRLFVIDNSIVQYGWSGNPIWALWKKTKVLLCPVLFTSGNSNQDKIIKEQLGQVLVCCLFFFLICRHSPLLPM